MDPVLVGEYFLVALQVFGRLREGVSLSIALSGDMPYTSATLQGKSS